MTSYLPLFLGLNTKYDAIISVSWKKILSCCVWNWKRNKCFFGIIYIFNQDNFSPLIDSIVSSIWQIVDCRGKWNESPLSTLKSSLHLKKVGLKEYWVPSSKSGIELKKIQFQIGLIKASNQCKASCVSHVEWFVFHQGNARSHVSLQTQQKLVQLSLDILWLTYTFRLSIISNPRKFSSWEELQFFRSL